MRKSLSTLFLVLVTLTLSVSSALAAPALANRNVTLQRVTYERGGITLLFHASGLTQADLQKTSFTAHSHQWNIACNFGSNTTVRCHVSKHLSRFAGESFHGTLAGFSFEGILPMARMFPPIVATVHTIVASETQTETNAPTSNGAAITTATPMASEALVITKPSTGCPAGQTLVYDFEWSGKAQSDGYITSSTTYYDKDEFSAEYGRSYDYVSTTYSPDGDTYYTYYFYNSYTFTSSGSIDFSQWDGYVANMQSLGYTVEKSGEHCE